VRLARVLPTAIVTLALAAGCDGASLVFTPHVQGGTQLQELTPAQSQELCASVRNYAQVQRDRAAFRDLVCRASALFFLSVSQDDVTDATVQSACESQYMLCQSRLAGTSGPLSGQLPVDKSNGTSTICGGSPPSCTATVEQYAACLNENYALTPSAYVPCSDLTPAAVDQFRAHGRVYPALDQGPACAAFMQACPGYLVQSPAPVFN